MLAAIAGIFTSDCDKCVRAAVCLNTSVMNTKHTATPLALNILFVSAVKLPCFASQGEDYSMSYPKLAENSFAFMG